jgi:hypothetical protein
MSICLLNVSFKIFTKVATNIISQIAKKVISPFQIGMAIRVRGVQFFTHGRTRTRPEPRRVQAQVFFSTRG